MNTPPPSSLSAHRQPIELGWVLAGQLDKADIAATRRARDKVREILEGYFPQFVWRMPLVHRHEMIGSHRVGPVSLLEAGSVERDTARWDFAFVVCEADLSGVSKPFVFGAPSQAIGVAVLSTARVDPDAAGDEHSAEERVELMASRITALVLHLFGHLNDLVHQAAPQDFMYDLTSVVDLDAMERYSARSLALLHRVLEGVADLRLEEALDEHAQGLGFVLRALWHGKKSIASATIEIRPWLFPFLLSRLTIAAVSTLLLLINTAEAWDLAMSQTPLAVVFLSLGTLFGTSAFVLQRQHLLSTRHVGGLTEQRVASTASIALAVLIGMATTYVLLFTSTLVVEFAFFTDELIARWASVVPPITWTQRLGLAGFVASLGLVIGALGASFEAEDYFRHVALVDEET